MCGHCVGAVDLMALDRRNDKGCRNLRDSLCLKITGRRKRQREWKIYYVEAAKISNAKAHERHQNGALQVYPLYPNHTKS